MRSFNIKDLKYLALAFCIALILWYIVIGREQTELNKEVRIEYTNIPNGLIIKDGIKPNFTVRLRGSRELLRTIQNRDLVYPLDLSDLKKGANAIDFNLEEMAEFRAFTALETIPPRIVLEVDELAAKIMPVEVTIPKLSVDSPYSVTNVRVEPENVVIKGASSLVEQVENINVGIALEAKSGTYSSSYAINVPANIDVSPPIVNIRYDLVAKQSTIFLQKLVQLDAASSSLYQITPSSVQLRIELPVEKANDNDVLSQIVVYTELETNHTAYTAPKGVNAAIKVKVPEGVKLINVSPSTVNIKLRPQN